MINIDYDPEVNIFTLKLTNKKIVDSDIKGNVIFDYDSKGNLVSVEILDINLEDILLNSKAISHLPSAKPKSRSASPKRKQVGR